MCVLTRGKGEEGTYLFKLYHKEVWKGLVRFDHSFGIKNI